MKTEMSFIFFSNPDEYRKFIQDQQTMVVEMMLQQRLRCYQCCGKEPADTWIRNLTIKNRDGSYAESLLGPACRAKFGLERPTEYKCFNNIEVAPVAVKVDDEKVNIE